MAGIPVSGIPTWKSYDELLRQPGPLHANLMECWRRLALVMNQKPSADQLALFSQIVANWRPMAVAAAFSRAERSLKLWPKPADLTELIVELEMARGR